LGLEEPGAALRQMQETSRQLSVLRNRACPPKLRSAVNGVAHNLQDIETLSKRLDAIDAELNTLSKEIDVTEARRHLAAARDALKEKDLVKIQSECVVIIDAVVGQVAGIPLVNWVEGLKKARYVLGTAASRQRMTEALDVLRGLEGIDRFRREAFHDSLTRSDELIAAAMDLYDEGSFPQATEQLGRCEIPLKIAGKASQDDAIASQLSDLWQQLVRANELITTDMDLARTATTEGFKLLDNARNAISKLTQRSAKASP
jgi:hypothetical protein